MMSLKLLIAGILDAFPWMLNQLTTVDLPAQPSGFIVNNNDSSINRNNNISYINNINSNSTSNNNVGNSGNNNNIGNNNNADNHNNDDNDGDGGYVGGNDDDDDDGDDNDDAVNNAAEPVGRFWSHIDIAVDGGEPPFAMHDVANEESFAEGFLVLYARISTVQQGARSIQAQVTAMLDALPKNVEGRILLFWDAISAENQPIYARGGLWQLRQFLVNETAECRVFVADPTRMAKGSQDWQWLRVHMTSPLFCLRNRSLTATVGSATSKGQSAYSLLYYQLLRIRYRMKKNPESTCDAGIYFPTSFFFLHLLPLTIFIIQLCNFLAKTQAYYLMSYSSSLHPFGSSYYYYHYYYYYYYYYY
jgi:hypothetical protein